MGRRSLTELFHLGLGVVVTATLFEAAAWAYPIGADTILAVGWVTTAAVPAMAAGPLWRAIRAERGAGK
jgi:hypothetical protein